jgi:anaerobic magnesium-protoporphyrin IX monomethyl ester cyclase
MRILLADLKATGGFVSKDTVAGGYGSRLRPFSNVTRVICRLKHVMHDVPSIQMAYLAAIAERAGHDVVFTRDRAPADIGRGDVAVVLSSLVDHRHEAAWADDLRARGARVGFVGLAASKLPELFLPHADFVIKGEPERAFSDFAYGRSLNGLIDSPPVADLDALPLPRWRLIQGPPQRRWTVPFAGRPVGGVFPVLASRGCPEFCTYCPHRILAEHRARSVGSVIEELTHLCTLHDRPYVIFRDPLFTLDRRRCVDICDEILARRLPLRFECETRLDRLDTSLIDTLHAAGLRAMSFGVESVSHTTLRRVGRRPTPDHHQREMIAHCRSRGIATAAFYVMGFTADDWQSVAATIDYAVDLGSTVAQFKLLTPYPGTPLWKQMAPLVFEQDWERFDGFTPTFNHPNLTTEELRFLLGAAYTRFYMRPSYLANYIRVRSRTIHEVIGWLDKRVSRHHARSEMTRMRRAVQC